MALEGVGAIVFGVVEATQIRGFRLVVGAGTAVLMLAYGAFLLAIARGVKNARRWSRGPGVATQLLHLPIAWSFLDGSTWGVALILAAVSLTSLVCLVLPSSTAVLIEPDEPVDESGTEQD